MRSAFEDPFNFARIETQMNIVAYEHSKSDLETVLSCNCSDSAWVYLIKDRGQRRFISYTHSVHRDTNNYLRNLPTRLDVLNLDKEFEERGFNNFNDSLDYVLDRMESKVARRYEPEGNWQRFNHCVDAESRFLKENAKTQWPLYLQIFDDTSNTEATRDWMLSGVRYVGQDIEPHILQRIPEYCCDSRYFFRMTGILMVGGSDASVEYMIGVLENNDLTLDRKKGVLMALYRITDYNAVKTQVSQEVRTFSSSVRTRLAIAVRPLSCYFLV